MDSMIQNKKSNNNENNINIFFDAEGTLYVTRKGFTYSDFWKEPDLNRAKKMFKLDKNVLKVLRYLRERKVPMYIVSKHNKKLLIALLSHFGIQEFFEEILINGDKGQKIKALANQRNIPINSCIMVGDCYELDIKPTVREGIRSLLINREYNKMSNVPRVKNFEDLLINWIVRK